MSNRSFFDFLSDPSASETENITGSVIVEETNKKNKTDYLERKVAVCHLNHPTTDKLLIVKNVLNYDDLLVVIKGHGQKEIERFKISKDEDNGKKYFETLDEDQFNQYILNSETYNARFHTYEESDYTQQENLKTIELYVQNNSDVNVGDIIEAIYTNDVRKVYKVLNKSADNMKLQSISVPELRISGGKGKKKTDKKKTTKKKAKKAKKTNKKKGK